MHPYVKDDEEATTLRPEDLETVSDESATCVQAEETAGAISHAVQARPSRNVGLEQRFMQQRSLPSRTVHFK
jgi:hypothetical protein